MQKLKMSTFRPGEYLIDELNERGLSLDAFAAMSGCDVATLAAVASGQQRIALGMARSIGEALGTSAELWLDLEARDRGGATA